MSQFRKGRAAQLPDASTVSLSDLRAEVDGESYVQDAEATGSKHALETRVRRIRHQFTAKGRELAAPGGVKVSIPDAEKVFGVEGDKKAVITNIEALSTFSDAGFPIGVSANFVDRRNGMDINQLNVDNSVGFLYKTSHTAMGTSTNFHTNGSINLLSMNPFSRCEVPQAVYAPSNAVDADLLERYGMHDVRSLHEGIMEFPGESYVYVSKDSPVYGVAKRNSDILGIVPDETQLIHGKYMMMDKADANNIIERIRQGVFNRTPVTSVGNIRVQFAADGNVSPENMEQQFNGSVMFRYTYVVQSAVEAADDI